MARKTTFEGDQGEVEFVPSEAFVEAVNEPPAKGSTFGDSEIAPQQEPDLLLTMPEDKPPPPERYRELRPWQRDNLAQRLNEAAADGWHLAAVVGYQIILERAD